MLKTVALQMASVYVQATGVSSLSIDPYCLIMVNKHVSLYWRYFLMRHCVAYAWLTH